ncbi:hypothetical protein EMIHUDRAFT_458522 [Emiliania huxleyi CCMP1516]|uniref:Uncharacterized protein n=2 Tax=Emiliania huxleyi TaxID=2903 RepID=A0A0D3JB56_EMIH1|nr:hypothetical protein EMIHUDRAFT_458522 [Emiliania huxleyi CCMP1516]EOD20741.1 hypothetical protein EMIHUDRAFT_458522 [Emiliania huxleyi CCMP1516]|eukprot:XP_005773170.1 hypothetical protein EMIHUDRAFT_458522 [Emiliania huxleyi CCMP1516]
MKGAVVAKLAAQAYTFCKEAALRCYASQRCVTRASARAPAGTRCNQQGVEGPAKKKKANPYFQDPKANMTRDERERYQAETADKVAPPLLLSLIAQAEAQATLFESWAQFHAASEHEDAYELTLALTPDSGRLRLRGSQVARLRRASELVGEAAAKAAGVPGGEACALAMNTAANSIREAEAVAEKHNATVYIERVPPFSSLPTIEPKAIAPPPPEEDDDGRDSALDSGFDPFASLVLEDASVYYASRDDVLRQRSGEGEPGGASGLAAILRRCVRAELFAMGLPHALAACDDDAKLPAALSEAVARVHGSGGAAALGEMLANDLDSLAMSIDALLEVEEGADAQLHQQHGERWACALTADARRELAQTREEIAQAEAANEALSTHHADHEDCLSLLDLDAGALAGRVPQAEEGSRLADLECVGDIRTLLASLSSCSETRTAAIAEARALAERDDITAREI